MSNVTNLPAEDDYDQLLTAALTTAGLSIEVDDGPNYTPTTTATYALLNPGKTNVELVKISDYSGNTLTIPAGGRAQPLYKGHLATAREHAIDDQIIISDNYSFWQELFTAINSKLDNDGGNPTTAYDLNINGNSFRIRMDGDDMKFTDNNNAEISLSTLAAAAGVDVKVKVSNTDTTAGFLEDKITVTAPLSKTTTGAGGDEKVNLALTSAVATEAVENDYTAYEAIAAGKMVAMSTTTDTVEVVTKTTLATAGTEANFEADATTYIKSCYAAVDKVAVIFSDATKGYVIAGTVDIDKTITWGTAQEIEAGVISETDICYMEDDKVAMVYRVDGDNKLVCKVATLADTVFTLGAAVEVDDLDESAVGGGSVTCVNTDKIVVCVRDTADSDAGKAWAASVSGTTPTFGSASVFETGGTKWISVSKCRDDIAVVFYMDDDDGDKAKGTLLSVVGTAVSASSPVVMDANASTYIDSAYLEDDKMIVSWRGGASAYCQARVASVGGLIVSYGTVNAVNAAAVTYTAIDTTSATKAVIAYEVTASSDGKINELSISGTTITADSQNTFNGATDNVSYLAVAKVNNKQKVMVLYRDEADTNKGNAEVYQEWDNTEAIIGFAPSAAVAAATVAIREKGIIDNQTGLTVGTEYFISSTGTVSATNGTGVRLGVAKQTDELDIQISMQTAEAWDFFNATDITGAEAETLTDDSSADSLHKHNIYPIFSKETTWASLMVNHALLTDGAGGGTVDLTIPYYARINVTAAVNDYIYSTNAKLAYNGDLRIGFYLKIDTLTNTATGTWGLGRDEADAIDKQVDAANGMTRFAVEGTTLYAETASDNNAACTQETITGITITDWNYYEIEFDRGTSAKFYVNGTLEKTITTTLPTSSDKTYWGGKADAGEAIELYIANIVIGTARSY